MSAARRGSAVDVKEYVISEQKSSFFQFQRKADQPGPGCCAYLELGPVLEVVVSGQAGVELHPVARDPGDLASPQLGVTQQGRPLIDIMPSALQSASTWK